MLLFFTALVVLCHVTFRNHQVDPDARFSTEWWVWLSMTGVSLGCVLSVKWVGLFAIALVGIYTIQELWEMLGDLEMPLVFFN